VEEQPPIFGAYKDYRGVIHCHSFLSHDSPGQIADIVAAAQTNGLDFVMMTDHITPEAITNGVTGMQGPTLFILGAEISQAKGSILGIGLKRFVDRKQKTAQKIIEALQAAGYRVHLANTAAIQQYAGLKYTDDHSDARWLAH
jgi:predicted metal-dependent phosphoesterase TrpH